MTNRYAVHYADPDAFDAGQGGSIRYVTARVLALSPMVVIMMPMMLLMLIMQLLVNAVKFHYGRADRSIACGRVLASTKMSTKNASRT